MATLLRGRDLLDIYEKRFGLRRGEEVIQHELKDTHGASFHFEVDDIPIFCGGSNWIPADSHSKDHVKTVP